MDALGNPEKKIPPVIHITGTNGKGSTTALMRSILESSGMKVHVLTSPHLERFNERIVIAGREIQDDILYNILEEIRDVSCKQNIQVSFFEGITAAAFLAFSRVEADVTLLEVGLGGRLDATNVIEEKLASVITPISYDHTNILGETLTKIAIEKCGILRKNSNCIVSMQKDEAFNVIEKTANGLGVSLVQYEYDFGIIQNDGRVQYKSKDFSVDIDGVSLPGSHQYVNAATAIATLRSIYGNKISESIIQKGISNASWKGRLQSVKDGVIKSRFPKCDIWLECAHNPAGARVLSSWLVDQDPMDNYLIFSMTRNRDVNAFLSLLESDFKKIICTDIYSEPMAYRGKDIPPLITLEKFRNICSVSTSVENALEIIEKDSPNIPKRVVVTGSIFLVSDFLIANKN
jgi:dihydrofolate synthase/folylpolyglutamate synthase